MRHKEEIRVSRVYNFSAGPAVLPEEVLQEAAAEMMDYKGSGMSVMEMSHRSKWFDDIIKDAEKDLPQCHDPEHRREHMHHRHADGNDLRLRVEQRHALRRKEVNDPAERERDPQRHRNAVPLAF